MYKIDFKTYIQPSKNGFSLGDIVINERKQIGVISKLHKITIIMIIKEPKEDKGKKQNISYKRIKIFKK